jgi:UDP-N-acetylglucosamine 2-epimerase
VRKVLSVVGNRPQFIKSGPLSVALREAGIEEVVLHTGQHYDRELSEVFFEELGLAEPSTGWTPRRVTRTRCCPGS